MRLRWASGSGYSSPASGAGGASLLPVLKRGVHLRFMNQSRDHGPHILSRPLGRTEAGGLLFWISFCVVIVLIRGIRWDEHWDLAQVILGRVPYPEDHFLYVWTRDVRNLPIFISTFAAWLFERPEALNALRNVAWMLATAIPLYLTGLALTRSALCGHIAVVLALAGLHISFDASYPIYAWPAYFSNGHVGMGYAMAVLGLLLTRRWRTAAFMLGFMPSIHIIHMMPVAAVALAMVAWAWRAGHRELLRHALIYAIPGIILSAALWTLPAGVQAPASGPYYAAGDWMPIVKAYMSQGTHWSQPGVAASFTNSNFILASALLLCLGAARATRTASGPGAPWAWMSLYLSLCAAAVWGMTALHWIFGMQLPYILLASMPYRFANHATVLALAIIPGVLIMSGDKRHSTPSAIGPWLLAFALAYITFRELLEGVAGNDAYIRYLAPGDGPVYALTGAAAAILTAHLWPDRRIRVLWTAAWLTIVTLAGLAHQFGAACFVLGVTAVAAYPLLRRPRLPCEAQLRQAVAQQQLSSNNETAPSRAKRSFAKLLRSNSRATLLLVVLATLKIGAGEWRAREVLPISEFDRAITAHLDRLGHPSAMLASYPSQHRLQSRTGHPVLVDAGSADSMVYTPELAPSIQQIHSDLYGIRFYPPQDPQAPPWDELWKNRSRQEWAELGRRYGFSHVLSPNDTPLDLEPSLPGPTDTLYRLPE